MEIESDEKVVASLPLIGTILPVKLSLHVYESQRCIRSENLVSTKKKNGITVLVTVVYEVKQVLSLVYYYVI